MMVRVNGCLPVTVQSDTEHTHTYISLHIHTYHTYKQTHTVNWEGAAAKKFCALNFHVVKFSSK